MAGTFSNRRTSRSGYLIAGALGAALIAVTVIVISNSSSGSSSGAAGAFGTHYGGLDQRRVDAGVPTMIDRGGGPHIHPRLAVYVRGRQVTVPANIGIDPSRSLGEMASLHTHDTSGVIHVENASNPTLGQFFAIWGVPFSATELGPYKSRSGETVRMWVDGKPSVAFDLLPLQDGQRIVVSYGPTNAPPPPLDANP